MAPAAGALDGRVTTGQETRVISAGRLIQAGPGPLFELIADPAQSPRWDGHDNLAAAPAGQHLRRTGDVSTIALTGGSIGDNHALAAAPSPAVWAPQDPLTAIGSEGASWRAAGGRRYCFAADSRECVIRGTELRALAEAGAGDGGVVMSPSSRRQ